MYRLDNDQIWLRQMKYMSNFLECHHTYIYCIVLSLELGYPRWFSNVLVYCREPTTVLLIICAEQEKGIYCSKINAFCRYYDQNVPIPLQIFMDSKMHSTSSSRSQITCIARQSWGRLLYTRTSFLYGNKNEDTINDTDIISKAHYILVYIYNNI